MLTFINFDPASLYADQLFYSSSSVIFKII